MTPARLQEIKEAEARHWLWFIAKDGDGITILASDHGDGVFLGRMRDKQSASDTVLLRNAAPEMLAEIEIQNSYVRQLEQAILDYRNSGHDRSCDWSCPLCSAVASKGITDEPS